MDGEMAEVLEWHFHWKFWRKLDCIGGPIRWGSYAVVKYPGLWEADRQTAEQVRIKREMGLIK